MLGFAGFIGTPFLFVFLGFFGFFQYIKTVPDELFWANVRTSGARGFFVFLVPTCLIIVAAHLLLVSENQYSYAPELLIGGLSLTTGVSIIVFAGSLGSLETKEKRSKSDEADD